jgi:ankyrin repeat protein
LDFINRQGQTACMLASMNGHTEAVNSMLIYVGCDIHIIDLNHMTAFLYASQGGHVGVLQLLKDHGADVHAPNVEGVEPALLAAKNGHNAALGWFDSVGRVRVTTEHFKALAQSSLQSYRAPTSNKQTCHSEIM